MPHSGPQIRNPAKLNFVVMASLQVATLK